MNVTMVLTPAVALANRPAGRYGVGETIALSCVLKPPGSAIPPGGIVFAANAGTISAAVPAAGTATYTANFIPSADDHKQAVEIVAYDQSRKRLATVNITVVAPSGLDFRKRAGGVIHTNGLAGAGFRSDVFFLPQGVSYQGLEIREGSFSGKGSGFYADLNNITHPTGPVLTVHNGNQLNGLDTIESGNRAAPWKEGEFVWSIPWEYRLPGTTKWTVIGYADHKQSINALGVVTIGKNNGAQVSAKPGDPTVA